MKSLSEEESARRRISPKKNLPRKEEVLRLFLRAGIALPLGLRKTLSLKEDYRMDKLRLQELDVERINVIDEDGKVRMAISGSSRSPGWVIGGKVIPGRPKFAGIIFYNDDGVECGGLIFGNDGVSLTMDQKDQDQIVGLQYEELEDGQRWYGLTIWDRPGVPLADTIDEFQRVRAMPEGPDKKAAWKALMEKYPCSERLFAGRLTDGSVVVGLKDSRGRLRIRLSVGSDDRPKVEMLDEEGEVIWSVPRSDAECSAPIPQAQRP